jgi:hypothetical protein
MTGANDDDVECLGELPHSFILSGPKELRHGWRGLARGALWLQALNAKFAKERPRRSRSGTSSMVFRSLGPLRNLGVVCGKVLLAASS